MKFGEIAVDEAEGAILAHSVTAGGTRLRKAHRISRSDVETLRAAGIAQVVAARLDEGDLGEGEAAARLADALARDGVRRAEAATGRANLYADADGVLVVDRAAVDAINAVDPAITLATLSEWSVVRKGMMVATVKIIPFAVHDTLVERARAVAAEREAFAVRPFRPRKVGLVQTVLPGVKPTVLDKTTRLTRERLDRSGSELVRELRVDHRAEGIAETLAELAQGVELLVVFGASAVSDERDAIPEAIRLAGGEVERTGMPVDPGNLLVLGRIGDLPVIGAPGCARSPKENGFDWVLDRLMADIEVTARDIAGMGVGGLLGEIAARPQPREKRPPSGKGEPQVWGVLLAAGRSSRMGGPNKLLADIGGRPLSRHAAERVAEAGLTGAVCVVGHQAALVREALAGVGLDFVDNPDFAEGLSTSLKAGIAALPAEADGALVVLADMPAVSGDDIDRLLNAFRKSGGGAIVRATHNGKRGNPVILPRALFARVAALEGDTGARQLVEAGEAEVVDVEIGEAASRDIDTPDDLAAFGRGATDR